MTDAAVLGDLVEGYRQYAHQDELVFRPTTEEPATTPFCGFFLSFAFSVITTNGPG